MEYIDYTDQVQVDYSHLQKSKLKFKKGQRAKSVYHYTSIGGLESILRNKTLRFTNIKYMNDKDEIIAGLDSIAKDCNASDEVREQMRLAITNLGMQLFVCCFSLKEDSLPMWNYYTKEINSQGYNIEFDDKKLYIADGHHRYETALNYRNYCHENKIGDGGEDYVMMMLVDMEHEGLVVFPTHRIVRDLESFDAEKAEKLCEEYFYVEKKLSYETIEKDLRTLYDMGKKAYGFYSGGNGYTLLTFKDSDVLEKLLPDMLKPVRELDVTVLHSLILEKLFGIDKENMANQVNLTYTKDFNEAIASVKDGKANCAFILNPTRVTEIRDVAAAGGKMPQKSTYFYPKLITGLVMNKLF